MKYKIILIIAITAAISSAMTRYYATRNSEKSSPENSICEQLRKTTGKPYEYIEAALVEQSGSPLSECAIVNCSSVKQNSIQWDSDTTYANQSKGIFSVGFNGLLSELELYSPAFSRTDKPIHSFCAYRADHPRSRHDYIGELKTLVEIESPLTSK